MYKKAVARLVPGKLYMLKIKTNMAHSRQKFDGRLPGFLAAQFDPGDGFMFVEARGARLSSFGATVEGYAFLGPDGRIYELNGGQVYNFFFFDYDSLKVSYPELIEKLGVT
jgi:hypothetical protein